MIDHDIVAGGILGLLVGDALGVPYEFSLPEALPSISVVEMSPPAGFRAAHGVLPGTWSDDGSQALCLVATLAERGGFHAQDFANRIGNWASWGYLAVDGHVSTSECKPNVRCRISPRVLLHYRQALPAKPTMAMVL